jgi:hypothetical protein
VPAPAFAGGTQAITTTPVVGSPAREYPEVRLRALRPRPAVRRHRTFGLSDLAYTCLLAYWVGSAIEDYPVASMMVSGAITTALIAILFLRERRRRRRADRSPST